MTVEEEIARLRAENEELRQRIAVLEQRISELEGKSDNQPPTFVKPNRPEREGPKQPRKKRDVLRAALRVRLQWDDTASGGQ